MAKSAWRFIGIIAPLVMWGCVTASDLEDSNNERVRTFYTLRLGEVTKNAAPLPDYTPIYVDWHYSDGSVESILGFKGWDFDRDGRFEMVEVLNPDGSVQKTLYDFTGEGKIDFRE